ncbi:MAG TPA: HTH domain-containing protein [Anaeromyxobacter sp.]|nr:HTH domain-containing protein [Anaeromyxobacter sp.]
MTFTEAAIEVLRREGKPLHFKKITEIAVRESLLDHVGKVPDDTMADQLIAHCRLPHPDRRLVPIQTGTFALTEWGMDEDPTGLENLVELPPEGELPYRGRERHPVPSRDMARGAGRQEGRRRREEEGPRPRRFPPPSEVAYEILAGAGRQLSLGEIAAQGAERLLMPDAFVRDTNALQAALQEDNRRRESSGRRPLFQLDAGAVTLVAQPEPGERPVVAAVRAPLGAADARRAGLAALRRRLRECEPPTVEHVVCRMLERQGYRELKVAKRGREHVIYTARRRLGVADVRHGVRILRSSTEAGRRDVVELRRDLGHYGAQIGIVVTAGEATREARGEAGVAGQLPVLLLAGEALAEAFAEAGVGCIPVVVPELDEGFFVTAAALAEQEEAARRARREERERRENADGRRRPERPAGQEERPEAEARAVEPGEAGPASPREIPAEEAPATVEAGGAEDGAEEDEGPDGDELEIELGSGVEVVASGEPGPGAAEPGAQGERRRRRRRRRRRGGRGRAREGAPGQEAGPAGGPAEGAPGGAGSPPEAAAAAPEAPPAAAATPAPGGDGGSGE